MSADADQKSRRTWTLWMPLGIGFFAALFLIAVLGIWGTVTNISGAVIGKGKVQVSTTRTALQHPIGGVIAEILARDGDKVLAGDIILRLDNTTLLSELEIVEGELFEALANEARLEALVDDQPELTPHPVLREAADQRPEIAALMARHSRRLAAQRVNLDTQNRLLQEQAQQVREQITGIEAELAAKIKRKGYVEQELEQDLKLVEKGLIKLSVIFGLRKELAAAEGEIGKLGAKGAELSGKVAEIELKRHDLGPVYIEKAVDALSKLRPLRTKFLVKRLSMLTRLSQLEVRAPISGTIHDSKILGLRSVVVVAKPLLFIVPNDEPVSVAVQISSADIDQLYLGQTAALKFNAFSRRSTPVINGEVSLISADAFLNEKTRKAYYNVEISLTTDELAKLEGKALIPGMPVDAFISTSSRTPLSYITKPLMDYFDRAFRDA